jgi:serine/threonine protein kinase
MGDRVAAPRTIGRYVLYDEVASGGMATVHLGRMLGVAGFTRTVAIKRLHSQFAKDPEFVSMFIDEARLAARIAHPNVVSTIDIVNHEGEMLLVMDYVFGASLAHLASKVQGRGQAVPPLIAVSIMTGALYGLHAAHEARADTGDPLGIVHRDVSPQNILVGVDGVARVVDFGVAKAVGRLQTTREGQLKGKTAYMAPEQIRALPVDARTDVYAASVVLWEALVGQRLFAADHPLGLMNAVFEKVVPLVSVARPTVPSVLDAILAKGLARDPGERFPSARAMAMALEEAVRSASPREVGDWVLVEASDSLARRARKAAEMESGPGGPPPQALPSNDEFPLETLVSTSGSHVSDARPKGRGSLAWLAIPAAVVVAGVGAIESARYLAASPPAPGASASSTPATVPTVVESVIPSSTAVATPSPSAAASAVDPSSSHAPPEAVRGPVSRPPARASPPKSGGASRCDPPYTVDRDGTRHWKDGC